MNKIIKKSIFVFVFTLFSLLCIVNNSLNNVKALQDRELLTELSKDELYNLIKRNGVEILANFDDEDSLKDFIFETVQIIEDNPNYVFFYDFSGTEELANNIKAFVNNYYGIDADDYWVNSLTRYNLLYSTVYGQWSDRYYYYNCYAFAINRKEYPKCYSTTTSDGTYIQYQPGNFSGYPGGVFTSSMTIQNFSNFVKTDLENIGMTNVTIHDSMPTNIVNDRLICVRKGSMDYHFMYYNSENGYWYHKPSGTAILQYNNSDPGDSDFWTNERSINNVAYAPTITYDSDVVYITYQDNIISLNCSTPFSSDTKNINAGNDVIYEINIECAKSYTFISSALSPVNMGFYNDDMILQNSIVPSMTNNNCTGTITTYLKPGTYYLRVNYVNATDSGNITTSYQVTWPVTLNATFNTNLNILSNLHLTGNNDYHCVVSFNNTYGEKLFKFKLDAGNNATYPEGAIKVYTDSTLTNPLDRYSVSGLTYPASSNVKENELYVFLPEKGTYYIEITVPRNDYNSLQFLVSNVDERSINYLNTLATSTPTNVFSYKTEASYFKKVDISHKSKIKIELNSNTGCFNSTKLFIFKLNKDPGYDIGVNHYSLSSILQVNLTSDEDSYNTTLILDEGTYYIGYTNNINCSLNLNLRRLINTNVNMDGTLVADPMPNQGYTTGSEVLLNNGSYNNYNITEGFTRCIYLMNGNTLLEPSSRLLYDWYSSDDDVALVTQYGTVLAKSVTSNTNVTIYAILKEDPSVVYRKTFNILNDTLTYSNAPINIYTSMTIGAGVYTPIDLSDEIVPINILQYYSWSISQGGEIDYWGNIFAYTSSVGNTLYITGNYLYNPRVKVFVDAFVTLPMSGYELDYNPLLWDDEVEDNNNCYNYALNSQVIPGTNTLWYKQQPGQYSESMTYDYSDYDAMYTAVHNDFVKYNQIFNTNLIFTPIDKFAKCPEGTYKVALVACSDDWDYHWYRQDSDGYWSHKPGTDFVRRYDDSYDLIIDPSNCDWGDYDTFLGFFAVSPWNTMYTEPENMRTLGVANPSISLVDLDDIGDLEIGMSYYEVVQTLGSAGLDIGSGTLIQQYETTSNNIVFINYHLVNGEYVVASIDVK